MSSNSTDYEVDSFLAELEARHGGKITYRTFAAFYGDSRGIVRTHGVLLYVIDGTFRFQDFKLERSILGIPLKDREKYEKFESCFSAHDVKSMRTVSRKAAEEFCLGQRDITKVRAANAMTKVFGETALEIELENGTFMYFRFMDKTIENMITQAKSKASGV